jgi:hypothetical protein
VFFGIWMDWSTWVSHFGTHDFFYRVEKYGLANLVAHKNDTIHLIQPDGKPGSLQMNFPSGVAPCVEGDGNNTCTINTATGPYFFSCSSADGYSCPDPGIDPSPSGGPVLPLGAPPFPRMVKLDFRHLFGAPISFNASAPGGLAGSGISNGGGGTTKKAAATTNGPIVTVLCNPKTSVTVVDPVNPPGSPDQINASTGQTITWVAPEDFTLDFSKSPHLCKSAPSGGGPGSPASCTIAAGTGTYYYTAASSVTGCSANPNETVIVP